LETTIRIIALSPSLCRSVTESIKIRVAASVSSYSAKIAQISVLHNNFRCYRKKKLIRLIVIGLVLGQTFCLVISNLASIFRNIHIKNAIKVISTQRHLSKRNTGKRHSVLFINSSVFFLIIFYFVQNMKKNCSTAKNWWYLYIITNTLVKWSQVNHNDIYPNMMKMYSFKNKIIETTKKNYEKQPTQNVLCLMLNIT